MNTFDVFDFNNKTFNIIDTLVGYPSS